MIAGALKLRIQSALNRFGYQIRRLDRDVDLADADAEQRRLLNGEARTILEVGAADGRDAARYADDFPDAQVYAFEPVPESFERLRARTEANPRLHAIHCALGSRRGIASFNVANWLDSSSLLPPRVTGSSFDAYHAVTKTIEVPMDTIDAFCGDHDIQHIDLLKMDTQGAELMVIEGAAKMLRSGAIRLIYSEVQFLQLYEGAALADQITAKLRQFGYDLHNFYNLHHNHRGQLCWGDAIFVKAR